MTLLIAWSLLACSVPCESAHSGASRDACFHERVRADTTRWSPSDVVTFARQIDDPVVREATVMLWVRDHRGQVSDQDRAALCGILRGTEKNACERRLATAHLSR